MPKLQHHNFSSIYDGQKEVTQLVELADRIAELICGLSPSCPSVNVSLSKTLNLERTLRVVCRHLPEWMNVKPSNVL